MCNKYVTIKGFTERKCNDIVTLFQFETGGECNRNVTVRKYYALESFRT